jgi:hypothetical protein
LLGSEVVVCTRCGLDLRTGCKVVKEYQKFERSWDSGMSLRLRLVLFGICEAVALTAMTTGLLTLIDSPDISPFTFVFSWIVYTAMTGFLLGTYDHCYLKRSRSGRVELVRTWRVMFVPWPPQKIDPRRYAGVVNGARSHCGFWEWVIFVNLLMSGLVPAVIYYIFVMHKVELTVALTDEHGYPEVYVYRGWSEEQMHEVRQTLHDAMTV